MTALRRRMREDLQLRGLAPTTQQCSLEAVKHLAQYYRRAPDQLSAEEIRQYFLSLIHEKQVAASTFRIHLDGIRFCYERTLQRPWPVFALMRPRQRQTLPGGLSPQEVRSLRALVERPKARMCLQLIYACRLRLREGTQLQVADIDPQRLLVQVRQGKGGKDRWVPLAERTLELLRASWQLARPRPWLFPARHRPMPLPAPTLLLHRGKWLPEAMAAERVTAEELRAAVRAQGIGSLDEVVAVVLETDGSFSVIRQANDGVASALTGVTRPAAVS